jgi:small-conductance mechanosensitive channel
VFVLFSQLILSGWQHTGLLRLAGRLLLAMAAIRLIVYLLRYLFSPGGWLKALESMIAWSIWGALALHLTGILPQLLQGLEDMRFNIGKNPVNLLLVLQALLTVVITIFIALWLSRVLENKLMRAEQVNVNLRVVLGKIIRIILLFVATLIALSAVGLDITLLSVFGGALGVGLGFGLQRIASNYVSGFIILLDKSMQIGDVVSVDKHYGVVQDLRSRYMVLGKLDGTHVIIPNETLITTAVVNHSLTEHKGRVQIEFAISFDSPLELALQLMHEIAKQHDRVLETPNPAARIKGFSEHGVELTLTVWISDPENGALGLQSALLMDIWNVFKKNKISLVKTEAKQD